MSRNKGFWGALTEPGVEERIKNGLLEALLQRTTLSPRQRIDIVETYSASERARLLVELHTRAGDDRERGYIERDIHDDNKSVLLDIARSLEDIKEAITAKEESEYNELARRLAALEEVVFGEIAHRLEAVEEDLGHDDI